MFVVLTVPQLIFSFHWMTITLLRSTSVSPSNGEIICIAGAVPSTVTVTPAEGVSTKAELSVALLFIVKVPFAGKFQLYVHVVQSVPHVAADQEFPPSVDTSTPVTVK